MALSRLLLLCVLASEVMWDAETNPEVFVCSRVARKALNVVPQIQTALGECFGSANLSAPVQLPCTELHVATWENKSDQERKADVVASLGLLRGGVKMLRITAQAECGTSLLQRLENNIENYLLILTHLQLSGPDLSPSLSCVPRSTQSLSAVLRSYSRLILGKLERFVVKLEDRCASR
ncbi:thrombopoietin [Kryptolebias marmoratus]|uniref:thrombopoietin n=1 Tax=Kryptolebias marmoratus TaxID=37003 RepID=UPI0018AC92EE|nr:thrombopoietin [Kryptolebias marmoratus]